MTVTMAMEEYDKLIKERNEYSNRYYSLKNTVLNNVYEYESNRSDFRIIRKDFNLKNLSDKLVDELDLNVR